MPTFTISIPGDAPDWGADLITQLTQCLQTIRNQMNDNDAKLCHTIFKLNIRSSPFARDIHVLYAWTL